MKRKIFLGSVLATLASFSYAASNVTLYGQMDIGVVAGKAKHSSDLVLQECPDGVLKEQRIWAMVTA